MFDFNFLFRKKSKALSEIKVIIWDVDGVLWRNNELGEEVRKGFVSFLKKKLNLQTKAAEVLFDINNKRYPSWGRTAEALTGMDEREIIQEIEKDIYRPKFLKRDQKLLDVFKKLEVFRHVILTNSTYESTLTTLKLLGFPPTDRGEKGKYFPFEKILTIDQLPIHKPDKRAFREVLKYTKLAPKYHLMIGDSPEIDLVPATKLGMKTCFVGNGYFRADMIINQIYDLFMQLR